ncbi:hypothetical protein ROHU_004670 [Labeo rohita]|uniref:Uncharacterized protein n=1 Tax=Labeo rohita TaxID=84645 RepID=A0A498NKE5_LABRO|nr:hypothetical protein ROHU_004670 [Labeo rohita]
MASENNMNRFRKQFDVQNALKIVHGDDSEYEGCDSDSDEDIGDPDYTPNRRTVVLFGTLLPSAGHLETLRFRQNQQSALLF